MNVKATLSPDDLARACADAMWKDDDASSGLGMTIVDVGPGRATLTMTVQPHMVNGQRIAHGGFIFTLADSAFAFACNSHNEKSVAAQGNITFIRPGKLGDTLVADRARNFAQWTFGHLRRAGDIRRRASSPNFADIPAPSAAPGCRRARPTPRKNKISGKRTMATTNLKTKGKRLHARA